MYNATGKHGRAGGAVIGQVPSAPSPNGSTRIGPCAGSVRSVNLRASRRLDANTTMLAFSLHDVIHSAKGPNYTPPKTTTKLHDGTTNMWAFIRRWMFSDYYFMVQIHVLFPGQGSKSSCRKLIPTTNIPISKAAITKITTFNTHAFDSISYCLLQGRNK